MLCTPCCIQITTPTHRQLITEFLWAIWTLPDAQTVRESAIGRYVSYFLPFQPVWTILIHSVTASDRHIVLWHSCSLFLRARRYDSAVSSYVPVSVSVYHKWVLYRNRWTDQLAFWNGGFLWPILCCVYGNSGISTRIKLLPSGTLSKTLDLENFASTYRSLKRVVDLVRQRWTLWVLPMFNC